jgi:hypothetical protein
MSKVDQIEQQLGSLSQAELRQVRDWLDDVIEDDLEFTPEFEATIQQSERKATAPPHARRAAMSGAANILLRFDDAFKLPPKIQSRIEGRSSAS